MLWESTMEKIFKITLENMHTKILIEFNKKTYSESKKDYKLTFSVQETRIFRKTSPNSIA